MIAPELRAECVLALREGGGPKGECPVWDWREQVLYWCDIDGGRVNRFDPASGHNVFVALDEQVGSFALTAEPGVLLVALRSGLHRLDMRNGMRSRFALPELPSIARRLNDGRCDPMGRFWVGSMCDPIIASDRSGTLYRIDADARVSAHLGGLAIANGIAFSPDGRAMYLADTGVEVRRLWRFDYDVVEGVLGTRHLVAGAPAQGRPDGGCCDTDGCYWSAQLDAGRVLRYTPDGRIDRAVTLPVQWPTMCAFGGADLDILYITTLRRGGAAADLPDQPLAGSIFACHPGAQGLPETPFAG